MAEALRVAFAGTPAFASTALAAIIGAGFEVGLVLCRPDAAKGRGMKTTPGAVKALATARGIPVLQPASLREATARVELTARPLDVLIVAAYGLILPEWLLGWPRYGCLNIHASLLPRWRGAAPIVRALLAGDRETGISIMQMDAGLDTGPVIATGAVAIGARENAQGLHDRLAATGAALIVEVLGRLVRDRRLEAASQPAEGATYAGKVQRSEAEIDWSEAATAIDRRIRAFNPYPAAQTSVAGERIKIWEAEPVRGRFGAAGCVVSADGQGIVVACGDGAIVVRELQRAGGRRLGAAAFLAGHPLAPNAVFGA
jgi:methionyl-tRNA formyltransferase